MPRDLFDEDGNKVEVPTEEEINNYKAGHDANLTKKQTVQELAKTLGLQEGEDLLGKANELKEDVGLSNVENVRKMREIIKTQKSALREKGIETDDTGAITEKPSGMTAEEVQAIVDKNNMNAAKDSLLSDFTEDQRKSIEPQLNKAMALGGTLKDNLNLVVGQLFPNSNVNPIKNSINTYNAGVPRTAPKGEISDELKDIGMKAFGLTDEDFNKANNK